MKNAFQNDAGMPKAIAILRASLQNGTLVRAGEDEVGPMGSSENIGPSVHILVLVSLDFIFLLWGQVEEDSKTVHSRSPADVVMSKHFLIS